VVDPTRFYSKQSPEGSEQQQPMGSRQQHSLLVMCIGYPVFASCRGCQDRHVQDNKTNRRHHTHSLCCWTISLNCPENLANQPVPNLVHVHTAARKVWVLRKTVKAQQLNHRLQPKFAKDLGSVMVRCIDGINRNTAQIDMESRLFQNPTQKPEIMCVLQHFCERACAWLQLP
jgi:hypothetical protein